jgi:hypothetical protein
VDAPQEVVLALFLGRCLERGHDAALGVEAAHHVADRAVLAAGVHGLQDDQERAPVFGIEQVLQLLQPLDVLREEIVGGVLARDAGRVVGIDAGQPDLRSGLDEKPLAQPHGAIGRTDPWNEAGFCSFAVHVV